jgi:hypothetical protein
MSLYKYPTCREKNFSFYFVRHLIHKGFKKLVVQSGEELLQC